jgi:hypothetical protein
MIAWIIETTDHEEVKATEEMKAKGKKEKEKKRERKQKKEQKRKEKNAELRRRTEAKAITNRQAEYKYGWTGQQPSSGLSDLTPATPGVFASSDRF